MLCPHAVQISEDGEETLKKRKVTPVPESLQHGTQQDKHSLSSHVYPGAEAGDSRMCHAVFNQVALDVLAACLNVSPTSNPTGMPAPCQRSNIVTCFQTSETVGPRPKNLVTKDGYGSPGEMGASLGSPKLVKRNVNWKHRDSSATYLCNIFICKTGINYCLGLGSPKADPGRRIWAQVLYQGGDCRKHKWERKENEMRARKWATHHGGQWGPLSRVPSQDPWVMHLRIVPTKDAEPGASTNFCHLLVKYCL